MGHHNGYKRVLSRTGVTPREWVGVCSDFTVLVNKWSKRNDLAVYGGSDAADGQSVAAFYFDSCEIEVNMEKVFGVEGWSVGSMLKEENQVSHPSAMGAAYHEAKHAQHTRWKLKEMEQQLDRAEMNALVMMEEPRIEKRGVEDTPEYAPFLRSSALSFVMEDMSEAKLAEISDVWQMALLSLLLLGRRDAGVLKESDVADIRARAISVLGEQNLIEFRSIWLEFIDLQPYQTEEAMKLARKWVALLRKLDPSGEGDQEKMGTGSQAGTGTGAGGQISDELMKELEKILGKIEASSTTDAAQAFDGKKFKEEANQKNNEARKRDKKKAISNKVFTPGNDHRGNSSSEIEQRRNPTPSERADAARLAKILEKARYRDRSVTEIRSELPQGKLNMRAAIQNKAYQKQGSNMRLPSWDRKVRKRIDDPTLRLGVIVDISGSMGSAMEAMATTAWVLGEAGHRIQAKTAMAYFGSGVFPTLRQGQRLDKVTVYSAKDGGQDIGKAWSAIDGLLNLTGGDGVPMLVIVSDGQYTNEEQNDTLNLLKECKSNGVGVLWLVPPNCRGIADQYVETAGWGQVVNDFDPDQVASSIGQSAARSLGAAA